MPRQLLSGYPKKPRHFPRSLAPIGLRDVRDYRASDEGATQLDTASPFNVKIRSSVLADFTAEEVAELYRQHTDATGQQWSDEAIARPSS